MKFELTSELGKSRREAALTALPWPDRPALPLAGTGRTGRAALARTGRAALARTGRAALAGTGRAALGRSAHGSVGGNCGQPCRRVEAWLTTKRPPSSASAS